MDSAMYSHMFDGEGFQLRIDREDAHQLEVIEVGLRVAFAVEQENESSPNARPVILLDRLTSAVWR